MKTDITITAQERAELERLVANRNTPAKVVWRAEIILASAAGESVKAICRATGKSKPCVWRWQARFAEDGIEGLKRDKTRPPGRKPLPDDIKAKVLTKTATETPPGGTHWSVRSMAKAIGISHTSVQRIWREAGLKPHLVKTFKVSTDPDFEEKVTDVVGLYLNPPDKALVLCVMLQACLRHDEKSQIQALDRSQPGLPLKPGRAATMTHDYKRHGTTTLFAALDVASGFVVGECLPRHRAKEFLRFLRKIDRTTKKSLDLHLVLDNYGTHKTPEVKAWLAKHPRFHLHFTPKGASWMNLVERFFAELTTKRIRRGVFTSVGNLEEAIHDYLDHHNADPKPFVWTKTANTILAKERRALEKLQSLSAGNQASESEHSDVPSQALRARIVDVTSRDAAACGGMDRAEAETRPEDDGDQALMRGLDTACPFVRPGLPRSRSGRRSDRSAT
jgi:transposase